MDQVHVIRHKVLVEGLSARRVAREMGVSRNTVQRYLLQAAPTQVERLPRDRPVWEKAKARLEALPREKAKLLAGRNAAGEGSVPLAYRVANAFLQREGMRKGEAQRLACADVDLDKGIVSLDENKAARPRSWVLNAGVAKVLANWKRARGGPFGARPLGAVGQAGGGRRLRAVGRRSLRGSSNNLSSGQGNGPLTAVSRRRSSRACALTQRKPKSSSHDATGGAAYATASAGRRWSWTTCSRRRKAARTTS